MSSFFLGVALCAGVGFAGGGDDVAGAALCAGLDRINMEKMK